MAAREQGSATPGGAGTPGGPTPGTTGREARGTRPAADRDAAGRRTPAGGTGRNRLGWVAITVAGLLTAWQIIFSITVESVANRDTYESIGLMLVLVLAVGSKREVEEMRWQRVSPRWPAVAALAVGAYAFVVAIAQWIGGLVY